MESKNSKINKGFKGDQEKEQLAPFFMKLFPDVLLNTLKDLI